MWTFIADITFTEVMLSLIAVGLIDHALCNYLPDEIAGPGGWLIDTGDA